MTNTEEQAGRKGKVGRKMTKPTSHQPLGALSTIQSAKFHLPRAILSPRAA